MNEENEKDVTGNKDAENKDAETASKKKTKKKAKKKADATNCRGNTVSRSQADRVAELKAR